MTVESFRYNITCWGAVVFEKWVKEFHKNNVIVYNGLKQLSWKHFYVIFTFFVLSKTFRLMKVHCITYIFIDSE